MHDYGIGAICSVICPIQADFFEKRSVWREARVALGSDMPGAVRRDATVGFTLQLYGRLCEQGLAVGISGGGHFWDVSQSANRPRSSLIFAAACCWEDVVSASRFGS